ncbi:hypothetical protein ACFL2Q_15735 [Thermodesulfobacteriota bacterium]
MPRVIVPGHPYNSDILQLAPVLNAMEITVLVALTATLNRQHRSMEVWKSEKTPAKELGVTDRTIREALRKLKALGIISVRRTRDSNRYSIQYPWSEKVLELVQLAREHGGRQRGDRFRKRLRKELKKRSLSAPSHEPRDSDPVPH